jgi:hypothetical protein
MSLLPLGCPRPAQDPAATRSYPESTFTGTVVERAESCRAQAGRFAERALWKGPPANGDDVLLGSTAHYSRKHGECDVLTEHRVRLADGGTLAYSELWDAFGATALAVWTGESGPAARGVCRVNLSDRPLVSCLTARFFIDDRMRN